MKFDKIDAMLMFKSCFEILGRMLYKIAILLVVIDVLTFGIATPILLPIQVIIFIIIWWMYDFAFRLPLNDILELKKIAFNNRRIINNSSKNMQERKKNGRESNKRI
jgi:hypothetical protein